MARVWGRLTATRRGRLELAASGVVVVLLGGVALSMGPAIANAEKITGEPVPEELLPTVVSAALSCPALTPARLAGQLMAESGFTTAGDGSKIAGISDSDWKSWKPSDQARRADPGDNIVALAHHTCQMVGVLRSAKFDGDLWQLAVAAQHGGLEGVLNAKGIPESEKSHVDKAAGYAAWYADSDQFAVKRASPAAVAVAPADTPADLPAELVKSINEAGRICPEVTPARVAAQLRAASNFNVNLRTDAGEGIAQFSPKMWQTYAGKKKSVWDAKDAISTLGTAMCDLSNQFSAFTGADPYALALGALQWGPDTIRQAGGLPETTLPQLSDAAGQFVALYQKDARLNGGVGVPTTPKPSASVSASASASPSVSAGPSPSKSADTPASPTPSKTTKKPQAAPKLYEEGKVYQIRNGHASGIIEVPGADIASMPSGTRVQMYTSDGGKDQRWRIVAAPEAGYVNIVNHFLPMSLAVKDSSKENHAALVVQTTNRADPNQQWKLSSAGNGYLIITNRNSGKAIDLLGDDLKAPNEDGTWNAYSVQQWDYQDYAKDQRWALVEG
ncbi:MAG TPA: RICIN domain-containing protein [Actinoplanes sp.]|nr:RICIN domain-containing protein [Actinoplanes sp.]